MNGQRQFPHLVSIVCVYGRGANGHTCDILLQFFVQGDS